MKINRSIVKGSILLLVAFNIYNLLNFVFQSLMARMLGLVEFSIYGPLSALIYLLTVVSESSQTVVAKYTSGNVSDGSTKNIIKRGLRKSLLAACIVFLAYLLISFPLSKLLRVSMPLILLTGLLIFTSFLVPVGRGALLGRKKFLGLGLNLIFESVTKIVVGVLLVYFGFKVYGAMGAILLSLVFAFILSFFPLRRILSSKETSAHVENLNSYSIPTFFVLLSITAFYVVDLIIARAIFTEEISGTYAIVALLGKAIFWSTQPISKAMFPISADKTKEDDKNKAFPTSLIMLLACISVALVVFLVFPELIIKIFAGKVIPGTSEPLFIVGLAFSILSISNIVLFYKLSKGYTKKYWLLIFPVIIEIFLLTFTAQTITSFSISLLISSLIFLIFSAFSLRK